MNAIMRWMKRRRRHPYRRIATVCLLWAVGLGMTPVAVGQSDGSPVPRQITVSQLEQYMDWLSLNHEQALLTIEHYRTYVAEYRIVREKIDPHLRERSDATHLKDLFGDMRKWRRRADELRKEVNVVDSRFFDTITPLLEDEQIARLTRARNNRFRHSAGVEDFFELTGRPFVDLVVVADTLSLIEASDSAFVDTILTGYDARLHALMRRLAAKERGLRLEVMEVMLDRGFDTDFGAMGKVQPEIWPDLAQPMIDLAARVDDLNADTAQTIQRHLSGDPLRQWRDAYIAAMYPDAHYIYRRRMRISLAGELVENLSSDEQDLLRAAEAPAIAQSEAILERLIVASEAAFQRASPWSPLRVEQWPVYTDLCDASRAEVIEIIDELRTRLRSELGEKAHRDWARAWARATTATAGPTHRPGDVSSRHWVRHKFAPMSRSTFELCKKVIAADNAARILLDDAYRRYLAQATIAMKPFDDARSEAGADWVASQETVEAMNRADDEFFELMGLTAGHEWIDNLRALRERELGQTGVSFNGAGAVDPIAVILNCKFAGELKRDLKSLVDQYDREANPLIGRRLIITRQMVEQTAGGDSAPVLTPESRENQRRIAELNINMIAEATLLLPDAAQHELRLAFNEAAYGYVLYDRTRLHETLERASELRDLDEDQLSAVTQLAADYEAAYERTFLQMARVIGDAAWFSSDDRGDLWPSGSNEQERKLKGLRFDRQEFNGLTRLQLRWLLSPDQLRRVGLAG